MQIYLQINHEFTKKQLALSTKIHSKRTKAIKIILILLIINLI